MWIPVHDPHPAADEPWIRANCRKQRGAPLRTGTRTLLENWQLPLLLNLWASELYLLEDSVITVQTY